MTRDDSYRARKEEFLRRRCAAGRRRPGVAAPREHRRLVWGPIGGFAGASWGCSPRADAARYVAADASTLAAAAAAAAAAAVRALRPAARERRPQAPDASALAAAAAATAARTLRPAAPGGWAR